jgi:hypothetical protein
MSLPITYNIKREEKKTLRESAEIRRRPAKPHPAWESGPRGWGKGPKYWGISEKSKIAARLSRCTFFIGAKAHPGHLQEHPGMTPGVTLGSLPE